MERWNLQPNTTTSGPNCFYVATIAPLGVTPTCHVREFIPPVFILIVQLPAQKYMRLLYLMHLSWFFFLWSCATSFFFFLQKWIFTVAYLKSIYSFCRMNIFRREKNSTAPTPMVPPRPTKEELEHPITHSQTPMDAGVTSGSDKTGENASDPTATVRKKPVLIPEVSLFHHKYLIKCVFHTEEKCEGCHAEGQPLQIQRTGEVQRPKMVCLNAECWN